MYRVAESSWCDAAGLKMKYFHGFPCFALTCWSVYETWLKSSVAHYTGYDQKVLRLKSFWTETVGMI